MNKDMKLPFSVKVLIEDVLRSIASYTLYRQYMYFWLLTECSCAIAFGLEVEKFLK